MAKAKRPAAPARVWVVERLDDGVWRPCFDLRLRVRGYPTKAHAMDEVKTHVGNFHAGWRGRVVPYVRAPQPRTYRRTT